MGGRAGGGGAGFGSRSGGDASMRHLSAAAQKAAKTAEEQIRNHEVEHGVVMDENGNIYWQGTDNKNSSIHYGADRTGRITIHNHPAVDISTGKRIDRADNGGSFSKADLMNAANYNQIESRVVTGKYTFSIRRPATGWKSDMSNRRAYGKAKRIVDKRIQKYYDSRPWGTLKTSSHRVSATYWHLVNKEYAKIQGYKYTKTKIH